MGASEDAVQRVIPNSVSQGDAERRVSLSVAVALVICSASEFGEITRDRSWYDPVFGKSWAPVLQPEVVIQFTEDTSEAIAADAVDALGLVPLIPFWDTYSVGVYAMPEAPSRWSSGGWDQLYCRLTPQRDRCS